MTLLYLALLLAIVAGLGRQMVVFAKVERGEEGDPKGELKQYGEIGRAGVRREATICALELLLP